MSVRVYVFFKFWLGCSLYFESFNGILQSPRLAKTKITGENESKQMRMLLHCIEKRPEPPAKTDKNHVTALLFVG